MPRRSFGIKSSRAPIAASFVESTAVSTILEDEEEVDITDDVQSDDVANTRWHLFGTECPKAIIVISIYNLTTCHVDSTLWTALLNNSSDYLLPNPTVKRNDG